MMRSLAAGLSAGVFLLAAVLGAGAQAADLRYDHRVTGDRSLTIQLGPLQPLAFQSFSGGFAKTNLSTGGTLGIDLDFYLNDTVRLGGGLRGKATLSPNNSTLFMVPITFRATWDLKATLFGLAASFPVGLGAGFSFTNFRTSTSFDPILMPTAGAYWNMSSSWSFGLDTSVWAVFQPYFAGGTVPSGDSRIAWFTDLTLGAIYHF